MKIRADEHVSQSIVRMICELAPTPGLEFTSIYDVGHGGTGDDYWATEFANDGGQAIVSADTDFFRKANQVVAIDRTGLKVIHLPSKWANAPSHLQAAHILMWWPRIKRKLQEAKSREVWLVPWNINEDGELRRKKVDYAAHYKKLKKAQRRAT
ncbi:MAG: DUF5615 family PIN-like protein [Alphaproteobacteria bacterium]